MAAPHRNGGDTASVVIHASYMHFVREALVTVAATDILQPDIPASIEELDTWIATLTRLRANLAQLDLDVENVDFTESRELLLRVADILTREETAEDPERFPADAAAVALARAIGHELHEQLGEDDD